MSTEIRSDAPSLRESPEVTDDLVVLFLPERGDFAATRAAEEWLAAKGYSVGRSQRGAPRGILRGDFDIQKWRNLNNQERCELDGQMTGDGRDGPVTVRLFAASTGNRKDGASPQIGEPQ